MGCIFDVNVEMVMNNMRATYVGPIKYTYQFVLTTHL